MKKFCFAVWMASVAFSAIATVPARISAMMENGEFNKVERLIGDGEEGMTAYESDSVLAIISRIRSDFSLSYDEGVAAIMQKYPHASSRLIDDWEAANYIETKVIDGKKMMFAKSPRNVGLVAPELAVADRYKQMKGAANLANFARTAIEEADADGFGKWRRVKVKFAIDVDADAVDKGKTIRVWMPFPIESERQANATLLSSTDKAVFARDAVHNTIYMERKADGKAAHFEAVMQYDVCSKTISQDAMLRRLLPYDTSSDIYKKYTAQELPQIQKSADLNDLAWKIVGNETNPVLQASLVFNWIDARFPWAGAREYSTIPCLPRYVLERGYGDCGQVTLLYITLLRNLGIPARWESGWWLAPGDSGMHDWGEVYFEGIGWVPVDMSYGMIAAADTPEVAHFYKSGMDFYRFAANKGVCGLLSPKKKYVRSETVDSQLGEVEWDGGNLFYHKDWHPKFEILSIEELP